MASGSFATLLEILVSDRVTQAFCLGIGLVFARALWAHARRDEKHAGLVRTAPSLLTSLGVLGTFCGIFIGLLDFNVADIDASVPALLGGLRLAFLTSIVGMGAAILFKAAQTIWPHGPSGTAAGASADDILAALHEMRDQAAEADRAGRAAAERLRAAMVGDADSSLVTQILKLRTTVADKADEQRRTTAAGFEGLSAEFRAFAEKVAENNAKALVDALREVIRDFNAKINEQFGDNFKQLNQAVGQLLVWQENYRQHVEALTARFEEAERGIEATRAAVDAIAARAETIPATMDGLAALLAALRAQTDDLAAHLEAVAALKSQAMEAFPVVERNLAAITDGMRAATQRMTAEVEAATTAVQTALVEQYEAMRKSAQSGQELLEAQKRTHGELEKGVTRLGEATTAAVDGLAKGIEGAVQTAAAKFAKTADDHSAAAVAAVARLNESFDQAIRKGAEALGGQLDTLDKEMQQEITRVIELMGGKLTSLSEQFVKDYAPLTERLRALVETARAVP